MSLAVFIAKQLTSFKTARHCEAPLVFDSCEVRRSHSGVAEHSRLLLQPTNFIPRLRRHLNSVVDIQAQAQVQVQASRFFDILTKVSAFNE